MGNAESAQVGDNLAGRNVQTLNSAGLKARLARGVQYNVRVVIRGDRNTGKTQLFRRLQGQSFSASYEPTKELQAATVDWCYRATSDVVMLSVWDVVDKASRRRKTNELIISHQTVDYESDDEEQQFDTSNLGDSAQGAHQVGAVDASMIDIYKDTAAAVFLFDITKKWTWDYVVREAPKAVKKGLDVLIVGNFRDLGEDRRTVSRATAESFAEMLNLDLDQKRVYYLEASMKNAFGVKSIASFFCIPFLNVKKKTLLTELENLERETSNALSEYDNFTSAVTYDMYIDSLKEQHMAMKTARNTPPPTPSTPKQAPASPKPAPKTEPKPEPKQTPKAPEVKAEPKTEPKPAPKKEEPKKEQGGGFMSMFGSKEEKPKTEKELKKEREKRLKEQEKKEKEDMKRKEKLFKESVAATGNTVEQLKELSKTAPSKDASVDDFVPDDDDGWLTAATKSRGKKNLDDDGWIVDNEDGFAFGEDEDDDNFATPMKSGGTKKQKMLMAEDEDEDDMW